MARFLALYIGSTNKPEGKLDAATEQKGMEAWGQWAKDTPVQLLIRAPRCSVSRSAFPVMRAGSNPLSFAIVPKRA
jgi:hypothetical protein